MTTMPAIPDPGKITHVSAIDSTAVGAANAFHDSVERAEAHVAELAAACGLRVTTIHTVTDHLAAATLLQQIWDRPGSKLVPPELLHALSHAGNYVAAVFDDDRIVGTAVAFYAGDGSLHSHIAGLRPDYRGRSVGRLLKSHERAWALARDIATMEWTFDPLVRRNAHFNLATLGTDAVEFLPDFYGQVADGINGSEPTDRLMVRWQLLDAQPRYATASPSAAIVLHADDRGRPVITDHDRDEYLLELPADIEGLRKNNPVLAHDWRFALRDAIHHALDQDHRIVGMTAANAYLTARRSRT